MASPWSHADDVDSQQIEEQVRLACFEYGAYCMFSLLSYMERTQIAASRAELVAAGVFPEERLRLWRSGVMENARFLQPLHSGPLLPSYQHPSQMRSAAEDLAKVRGVLAQVFREWTAEGEPERRASIGVLLSLISTVYGDIPAADRWKLRVLCPGAGLGRLPYELVRAGFSALGVDVSPFMILVGDLIVNREDADGRRWRICPFVHQTVNVRSIADSMLMCEVPGCRIEPPASERAEYGILCGEFCQEFSQPTHCRSFAAVVSCFFLDTAQNIFSYIETVRAVLDTGGIWIHLGPMEFHWAEDAATPSVVCTLEDVVQFITSRGFFRWRTVDFVEKEPPLAGLGQHAWSPCRRYCLLENVPYCSNPASLRRRLYRCALWVCEAA